MRETIDEGHTRMLVVTDFMCKDCDDILRFEEMIVTHVVDKGVKENNALPAEEAMEKRIGLL